MPANGPYRMGMAPQISISSPDDPNGQCESSNNALSGLGCIMSCTCVCWGGGGGGGGWW